MQATRRLTRYRGIVPRVLQAQAALSSLADADLRRGSLALRYRHHSGEPLEKLQVEAFALVREAGRRALGMEHFDVQLIAGAALVAGSVIEMQTGEGKTLTATLPLFLTAIAGRGAHLATANDYLAARDAELMRPIFTALGLTVGAITSDLSRPARRAAYACDVTYGTAKEFGFDFLRDRLLTRDGHALPSSRWAHRLADDAHHDAGQVQREPYFLLADEADSILIDEARTPLVVSGAPHDDHDHDAAMIYRWAAEIAPQFTIDEHFTTDAVRRDVTLTPLGRRHVRELAAAGGACGLSAAATLTELYGHVQRAIRAAREYFRERHYIVRDGEVVIVDEFTGRLAEGRRWRDGLHQAIEAREGVAISSATCDAARVTLQDFMLRYPRLAGMTGTIATSGGELRQIYQTPVASVPTHRPPRRAEWPTRVLGTSAARWQAIADEVGELHAVGRPVLVGTRSIDKSEQLAALLTKVQVPHQVLNARHLSAEAEIVAAAGQCGRVTVATNMAGRGTDIQLTDDARALGGLHVIISELHESARIDRQLIGRCGRQGDPGSYRVYLSLEDDILAGGFGPARAARLAALGRRQQNFARLARIFHRAQARVEHKNFQSRMRLLEYERERARRQQQLGQDPYLDAA
jgi:preprotein translocase subunit SecA